MRHFKDRDGSEWAIDINSYTIEKVRADVNVDLLKLVEGDKAISDLAEDEIKLVAIVAVLTQEQRDERGKTDDDFKRSMNGESIDDAWNAIIEDLIDFSRPGRREVLRTAYDKVAAAQKLTEQQALEMVNSEKFDRALESQRKASEKLFASAVESLGQPIPAAEN